MKNRVLVIALFAAVLVGGALYNAVAAPLEGLVDEEQALRDGDGEGRFARLAAFLELSDEQREAIDNLRSEEREATAPLRRQLHEGREALHRAAEAVPFDETAVRTLAAAQAQTRTELIVSRARMQNRILALLTPEQRQLAEKVRPLLERRGPRR